METKEKVKEKEKVVEVKKRKTNVTLKTLKAWKDQTKKIMEDIDLVKPEEIEPISQLLHHITTRFIETKI